MFSKVIKKTFSLFTDIKSPQICADLSRMGVSTSATYTLLANNTSLPCDVFDVSTTTVTRRQTVEGTRDGVGEINDKRMCVFKYFFYDQLKASYVYIFDWTVIIRRVDGSGDFNRSWDEYRVSVTPVENTDLATGIYTT